MTDPTLPVRLRDLGRRLAAAIAGAGLAALAMSLLEAGWARAGSSQPPSFPGLWLALAGLLAPLGLGIGTAVGLGSLLLHPAAPPSWAALRRHLDRKPAEERARLAVVLPAAGAGALVWLLVVASLARDLLASPLDTQVIAVAAGTASTALAGAVGVVVLALGEVLQTKVPSAMRRPLLMGGVGWLVVALVLAIGIARGDVGGAGGPLELFGVLRREELDLRAPAVATVIFAAAYLAPALLVRLPIWLVALVAAAPLVLTWRAAGPGFGERQIVLAVERAAPTGRLALRVLQRLSDRDGDGFSAYFGGGDCDDTSASIGPGVDDIPENGIDEDCSGTDAQRIVLVPPKPAPPPDAETWMRQRIPKQLNVVLLTIDALRADETGFAGYPRRTTPNLDAFAKRAVVFDAAYAPASYTGKSLPPMLVGKHGSELHRGWAHFNRIDKRDRLIWERLQAAGVRTISVQGYWYFFRKAIGFERGWDVLDGSSAPGLGYTDKDESTTSDKIADKTIELLSDPKLTSGRFFFWTHYVDPHADYVRHEGFDFGPRGRDRYDGEVAFTEHHVGRILDHIAASDYADRTAIIISSDHGEAFGEHGMIRHGFEIWEPLVRVPLVVYLPGVEPRHVAPRRSLIDLVPTILDLYGIEPPRGEGDDFVSGESLLADVLHPPGHVPQERPVFVDMQAGPNNDEKQAFIEHDLKLIATNGRPEALYDLAKDPEEANDLFDSKPELRERMLARYRAYRQQLRSVFVRPTR